MRIITTFRDLRVNGIYVFDDGKETVIIKITKKNNEVEDADILVYPEMEKSFISIKHIDRLSIYEPSTLSEIRKVKKIAGLID